MGLFDNYASLIPDFPAFCETLEAPVITDVRVNTLRTTPADLKARLERAGHVVTPYPWHPGLFRVPTLDPPGAQAAYHLGHYTLQGASSVVPVLALEVAPGQRVIDLCAAPGSKTGQLAQRMENRGLVVANELKTGRTRPLHGNLERLGAINVAIRVGAGEAVPTGPMRFDRALVDAPCSGEGTARHPLPLQDDWAPRREQLRLQRRQLDLLRRAVRLVRPGGLIVYSTCTYSPLENEAVIARLLEEGRPVALEPVEVPGVPFDPAYQGFEDAVYPPDIPRCCRRLFPHRLNSWGFFIARLRRLEGAEEETVEAPPAPPLDPLVARGRRYLEERFGVDRQLLSEFTLHVSGRAVWVASAGARPHELAPLRPQSVGLRLLRAYTDRERFKPTTNGLLFLAPYIRRGRVALPRQMVPTFLNKGSFEGDALFPSGAPRPDPGYVLMEAGGVPLGCGLWTGQQLHSQLPGSRSREIGRCDLIAAWP